MSGQCPACERQVACRPPAPTCPHPFYARRQGEVMSNKECPAALSIGGQHYPCQQMEHMAEGSTNHDGWAHSNRDAEAIWASDRDPVPGMSGWDEYEREMLAPTREGRHIVSDKHECWCNPTIVKVDGK